MKFIPRPLGEAAEVNAPAAARRLEFPKLILWMAAIVAAIYLAAAAAAELLVASMTPRQEAKLFAAYRLPGERPLAELPEEWKARAGGLGEALALLRQSPSVPQLEYRLSFLEEKQPNAFAIPGGGICVTTGLLRALDSGEALAFVIGHELGHFAARDHLRAMGRGLVAAAGISVVFGQSGAEVLAGRAHVLLRNRYSRKREAAADAFALGLIREKSADTAAVEKLFEVLEGSDHLPGWAYMFATHPDPKARVRALQAAGMPEGSHKR